MGRRRLLLAVLVAELGPSCSPGSAPESGNGAVGCVDEDGDGRGVGADCRDADCDDRDPSIWTSADCDARCEDDPRRVGCACDPELREPQACYDGTPETLGVGICRGGLRTCDEGAWGACDGQVVPNGEDACGDGDDDDCDGTIDDGCQSERCDGESPCFVSAEGGGDWSADGGVGLEERDDGALVLPASWIETADAWVANTQDTTVSRIDTREGVEIARYPAVVELSEGVFPLGERCTFAGAGGSGNCPSRSAVAPNGDALVLNRAFSGQPTLTKFAADLERCPDRDGDGVVETSVDLDGDGSISTDPADGEYLGLDDECVVFTVPVGEMNGVGRALAIEPPGLDGAPGEVWVGMFSQRMAIAVDLESGEVLDQVALDVNPYGAAISPDGRIWFGQGGSPGTYAADIQSIDTETHELEAAVRPEGLDCNGGYGIAVDEWGRVWRGSYPCRGVFRYDPDEDEWTHFALDGSGESLGLTPDGEGRIWVGFWKDAASRPSESLLRIDADSGEIDLEIDIDPWLEDARGVGLDEDGQVWVVGRMSNNVIEVDPDSGDIRSVPVGSEPYTYSDFTGYLQNRVLQPSGYYDHVFEGCGAGGTDWYDVEVEVELPLGTRVEVWLRSADTLDGIASADWRGPYEPPADARDAVGRYLEVRVWLRSEDRAASPAVFGFSVAHSCGEVIG